MNLEQYFQKLKLELHLLGLEIDDEFEKIEGRPVGITVCGGEHNLAVSFGYPGDRRTYKGIRPEQLALEIYAYLQRKFKMEQATPGRRPGEVPSPSKAKPKPKPAAPKAPVKEQAPPRVIFTMPPSTLFTNAKHDYELQFEDFHKNVMVITKTGELKEAMKLRLTDLSPEVIIQIQKLLRQLDKLDRLLAST